MTVHVFSNGHLPPTDGRAEQVLLGALLTNNQAFEQVSGVLQPEHFVDPMHGCIYAAIDRLIESGQVADAVTLQAVFEQSGALDEAGGTPYIAQLLTQSDAAVDVGEIGKVIRDAWRRRQCIDLGEWLGARAEEMVTDAHGLTTRANSETQMREALAALEEAFIRLQGIVAPIAPMLRRRPGENAMVVHAVRAEVEVLAEWNTAAADHFDQVSDDGDAADRHRQRATQLRSLLGEVEA